MVLESKDKLEMAQKSLAKLTAFLESDDALKLKGPDIQMLIDQRWILQIIVKAFEKEVSEKND